MLRYLSVLGVMFAFILVSEIRALGPSDLSPDNAVWGELGNGHELHGQWKGLSFWSETFCPRSFYQYHVEVSGNLATVDFEPNGNETVDVYADFYDVRSHLWASYRSTKSLCMTVHPSLRIGVDRVEAYGRVIFSGSGESLEDLKVKITATRMGTVRMGKKVPPWMENLTTRTVNFALAKIWESRLGDWISAKLTEVLKKKGQGFLDSQMTKADQ